MRKHRMLWGKPRAAADGGGVKLLVFDHGELFYPEGEGRRWAGGLPRKRWTLEEARSYADTIGFRPVVREGE